MHFDLLWTYLSAELDLDVVIEKLGEQTIKKVEACVEKALNKFMESIGKKLEAGIATVVEREMQKAFKPIWHPV
jgi:hypothetical protein